jgi:hypothetical protein
VIDQPTRPMRSEDEQRAFFHAVLERTLAAEARAGIVERCIALAGSVVSLRFAGEALARSLTPALAHLEVPVTPHIDAVFHVWDSESTGVDMVAPLCSQNCFTSRGDIWTMGSARFRSAYLWSEYALYLFDSKTATGVYWTGKGRRLPYWAKASPLRCLFHWWAETKGCQLVHGAAIGGDGGAVLITGKGGLGKSTAALSCLDKGLDYIGDDYVVVQLDPSPSVHSLYSTAKLNWDQMERFPRFAGLIGDPDGGGSEKAVMYLYPELLGRLARSRPLQLIMTPRIGAGRQTEAAAVSTLTLQRSAAFTTMSQLPRAGSRTHEFIARLLDRLPGLLLTLGTDLDAIPDAIVRLLRSSGSEIGHPSNRKESAEAFAWPLISIVVPVRGQAQFLPASLDSIVAQDYPAIEIIVIDDGSTDGISDMLRQQPVDVRILKQRSAGSAASRNRGIRECSGELVAFLDAGDLWSPRSLQTMVRRLMANGGCDVVQGFGQLLEANGGTAEQGPGRGPVESFLDCPGAAVYRHEAFEKVGLFDPRLEPGEATDWNGRARAQGLRLCQLDMPTLLMRRLDGAMSRAGTARELGSLKALKNALDRERADNRYRAGDGPPWAEGH